MADRAVVDIEQPRIKCVKKIFEIPVITKVADNVTKVYVDVKNLNRLTTFSLNIMEKGAGIVLNTATTVSKRKLMSIPVTVADNLVCVVLNEVKLKVPVVYNTPDQLSESGKHLVLGSFVVQKVLGALEYGCRFSEAVLNIIPEHSNNDETSDEIVSSKGGQQLWSDHYFIAIKPFTIVKVTLRKLKRTLRALRQTYGQKVSSRSMSPDLADKVKEHKQQHDCEVGWVEMLISFPKKAMELLGAVAHEYSKLQVDRGTLLVDKSPSRNDEKTSPAVSPGERKRKHEDMDSDGSEDLSLTNLDDTYTSADDPDFESPAEMPSTDSLEYDSSSDTEELPIKDVDSPAPGYNERQIKDQDSSGHNVQSQHDTHESVSIHTDDKKPAPKPVAEKVSVPIPADEVKPVSSAPSEVKGSAPAAGNTKGASTAAKKKSPFSSAEKKKAVSNTADKQKVSNVDAGEKTKQAAPVSKNTGSEKTSVPSHEGKEKVDQHAGKPSSKPAPEHVNGGQKNKPQSPRKNKQAGAKSPKKNASSPEHSKKTGSPEHSKKQNKKNGGGKQHPAAVEHATNGGKKTNANEINKV